MTFGEALEVLKRGGRVYRAGWNGQGMWLCMLPGRGQPGYTVAECIAIKTTHNVMQPGWLPSQLDMLAKDWKKVEGEGLGGI